MTSTNTSVNAFVISSLTKQIDNFCKTQNCQNTNTNNLVKEIQKYQIYNNDLPNGLSIINSNEEFTPCTINNFQLYNNISGRINNLIQNNNKLRIQAGTPFTRPNFGTETKSFTAGQTWLNSFPSLCNCYKVNILDEKNNPNIEDNTNLLARCNKDDIIEKTIEIKTLKK